MKHQTNATSCQLQLSNCKFQETSASYDLQIRSEIEASLTDTSHVRSYDLKFQEPSASYNLQIGSEVEASHHMYYPIIWSQISGNICLRYFWKIYKSDLKIEASLNAMISHMLDPIIWYQISGNICSIWVLSSRKAHLDLSPTFTSLLICLVIILPLIYAW